MKTGKRALRLAVVLAADLESRLVARGCPPPPREDLAVLLWPLAREHVRAIRRVRQAKRFADLAASAAAITEATLEAAVAAVVASVPVPPSRMIPFDPAAWQTRLVPAGARRLAEREAA